MKTIDVTYVPNIQYVRVYIDKDIEQIFKDLNEAMRKLDIALGLNKND